MGNKGIGMTYQRGGLKIRKGFWTLEKDPFSNKIRDTSRGYERGGDRKVEKRRIKNWEKKWKQFAKEGDVFQKKNSASKRGKKKKERGKAKNWGKEGLVCRTLNRWYIQKRIKTPGNGIRAKGQKKKNRSEEGGETGGTR